MSLDGIVDLCNCIVLVTQCIIVKRLGQFITGYALKQVFSIIAEKSDHNNDVGYNDREWNYN